MPNQPFSSAKSVSTRLQLRSRDSARSTRPMRIFASLSAPAFALPKSLSNKFNRNRHQARNNNNGGRFRGVRNDALRYSLEHTGARTPRNRTHTAPRPPRQSPKPSLGAGSRITRRHTLPSVVASHSHTAPSSDFFASPCCLVKAFAPPSLPTSAVTHPHLSPSLAHRAGRRPALGQPVARSVARTTTGPRRFAHGAPESTKARAGRRAAHHDPLDNLQPASKAQKSQRFGRRGPDNVARSTDCSSSRR